MSAGAPGWRTTVWLATTGGRADRVRIALTALGAAVAVLALLAAATVAATGPGDGPYTSAVLNEVGLHVGVVIALVLLCVPVLAFTGQCSRIGAPARDRRLAVFRLAGATPGDVVRVAAVETGLAAGLGALLGLGAHLLGRVLLGDPVTATYVSWTEEVTEGGTVVVQAEVTGPALRLPTDVLPPSWSIVLVVLAVPVLAGLLALGAMRRVRTTPFGVVRLALQRPVRVLPAALFLVGTAGMAFFTVLIRFLGLDDAGGGARSAVFVGLFVLTTAGLVLGTAALSTGIGRVLTRRTSAPSVLLAGRRLVAAPFQVSRAAAALLAVVVFASAVQGYGAWLRTLQRSEQFGGNTEALAAVDLALVVAGVIAAAAVLVGTTEGVLSRRRSTAAMAAAGVPRGVLGRALLLETLLPVVPAALLAAAAGVLGVRGVFGAGVEWDVFDETGLVRTVHLTVPVPWSGLGVVLSAAVLGTAALAVLTLPLLRRTTDPAELAVA
jgi:hypothetical protein